MLFDRNMYINVYKTQVFVLNELKKVAITPWEDPHEIVAPASNKNNQYIQYSKTNGKQLIISDKIQQKQNICKMGRFGFVRPPRGTQNMPPLSRFGFVLRCFVEFGLQSNLGVHFSFFANLGYYLLLFIVVAPEIIITIMYHYTFQEIISTLRPKL